MVGKREREREKVREDENIRVSLRSSKSVK